MLSWYYTILLVVFFQVFKGSFRWEKKDNYEIFSLNMYRMFDKEAIIDFIEIM